MKTIKYKTLNGLLSQTRQMTIEQFLNKRFYHKSKGWVNFDLDGYIYDIVLECFSKYCFSSKKAQNKLFFNLINNYEDSSSFRCFYIDKKGFSIRRFNK